MMGMTHVCVGTMAALMLTELRSPRDCLAALIGGALGAAACDMDLGRQAHQMDADRTRRAALGIAAACLAVDFLLNAGLIRRMRTSSPENLAAGVLGLTMLYLWGSQQPHRGATHSVLMVVLMGFCMKLVCAPVSVPLMIGMGSHLVLDLFNRKPVQLLYPVHGGVCLGLCRADGALDRMIRGTALLGTVFALGMGIRGFL